MSAVLQAFIVTIDATSQALVVALGGVYLARSGFVEKAQVSVISRTVMNLILPCLIFTDIITSVSLKSLEALGQVILFTTIHVFLGLGLGIGMGKLTGSYKLLSNLMGCSIGFNNATAIPLIFAQVLGSSGTVSKDFKTDGVTYALLFSVIASIYKWTVAYVLMEKPLRDEEVQMLDVNQQSTADQPKQSKFLKNIKSCLNPPVYAMLIALPLSLIPYMKKYVFVGSSAVLDKNVFAALLSLGAPTSTLIMIILGVNLSKGYPPGCDISNRQLAMVIVGKLVIMPLFGLGFFYALFAAGFISKVMALMMMIIYTTPTSTQLLMICNKHQSQEENLSKICIWTYFISPLTITAFSITSIYLFY